MKKLLDVYNSLSPATRKVLVGGSGVGLVGSGALLYNKANTDQEIFKDMPLETTMDALETYVLDPMDNILDGELTTAQKAALAVALAGGAYGGYKYYNK